jgi:hypothetical protein
MQSSRVRVGAALAFTERSIENDEMKALFRRPAGPEPESPSTVVVPTSTDSLFEFRSETEPLVLQPPPEPPQPVVPRPFRMEREKRSQSVLPIVIFAALIAASLAVVAFWVFQSNARRAAEQAQAAAAAARPPVVAPPPVAPPAPTVGALDVTTDPPGASVLVDGTNRGRTPLVIQSLPPGPHDISIVSGGTSINRKVTVTAGGTATVMASVVAARAEAGWVALDMPFEAEILERGRLLGTTAAARIALPPGSHDLELRNTGLGYRTTIGVQVVSGQTVRPSVNAPTGLVSINALPWAEVLIDGKSVGTTPLANLPVAIGSHTVVLKHPSLGERRQTIRVVGGTPIRIGVSFEQ